jgi:phosphate uptake regulator
MTWSASANDLANGRSGRAGVAKRAPALESRNRQLAYVVILGDRRVDEMERESISFAWFSCSPATVAGPLRFAYSTIRINLELERIGDYAESIARQVLKVIPLSLEIPFARFSQIANFSIPCCIRRCMRL